jgi:C-8 sterol isomerase
MKDTRIYLSSLAILVLSSIYAIYCLLETNLLECHYIFTPEKLHALSLASIQQHGNDTKAIVANIVEQLRTDDSVAPYLSVGEEWMFNNAGGAMGAMYIIHASKSNHPSATVR